MSVKKNAMTRISVGSLMHYIYTVLSCWLVKHVYKYIYEDKHPRYSIITNVQTSMLDYIPRKFT